ncbi:MAG TPA: Gfo/Idh/MocA family oxidoreductase [Trueperaceae bacterium]|nr:Gfo/Idh/MocA family oxidoreductase [Trueperaceae bacterium]
MSKPSDLETNHHVRWGFIGCGDVTEVKSGPAFSRVAGSSISAVMRRDGAKARDYAERHGVPRWTTDADEVINASDVDAVYIATPPSSHAEYVARAAAAGKPVYVEKPLARSYAEGEAMVRDCERAGVPLFVAYYRRALPRFEFVREHLQDGSIGEPAMVRMDLSWPAPTGPDQAGWRWDPEVAGDGLLLDLGSHGLDLLDHWLGPIAEVDGFSATRLPWSRVKDEVVGSIRFASGVLGAVSWSFAGPGQHDLITITGSSGRLTVPLFAEGPVRLTEATGRTSEHAIPHPMHVHEPLVETIVGELLGRGTTCPSTGASALRTQRVMDDLLA